MIPATDHLNNLVHWQENDSEGRCVCEGHYLSYAELDCRESGIRYFQVNHFCLMMGVLDWHFPEIAHEVYQQNNSDRRDIFNRVYYENFWIRTHTARKIAKCTVGLEDIQIQNLLDITPQPHPINPRYTSCSIWDREKIHWKSGSSKEGDLVKNVRSIEEFLMWNGGFKMRRNPEAIHPYG